MADVPAKNDKPAVILGLAATKLASKVKTSSMSLQRTAAAAPTTAELSLSRRQYSIYYSSKTKLHQGQRTLFLPNPN